MFGISKVLMVFVVLLLLAGCAEESALDKPRKKRAGHLVEVIEIIKSELSHNSTHTGTLRASRTVRVFNQEEGRIERLPFYEGDVVDDGVVLVKLDDRLLKAQLVKAIATRKQAELDLQRVQDLMQRQLVSKGEKERAETLLEVARSEELVLITRIGFTEIKSSFAGVVSQRLIEPGDIAPKYTHLLTLYDPESLVTEIAVSELLLPFIKKGDAVTVKIDALGDQSFKGVVKRIHPTLDEKTRRSTVEVVIEQVPEGAMVGQFCRVFLDTQARQRIVIPFKSLLRDREGEYVFQVQADNKVNRKAVRAGLRLADKVEIISGLSEGDKVVTRGFFGLHDGKGIQLSERNSLSVTPGAQSVK